MQFVVELKYLSDLLDLLSDFAVLRFKVLYFFLLSWKIPFPLQSKFHAKTSLIVKPIEIKNLRNYKSVVNCRFLVMSQFHRPLERDFIVKKMT